MAAKIRALFSVFLALSACAERGAHDRSTVIRLVEMLPQAKIESPFDPLGAVGSIEGFESAEVVEVFRHDFRATSSKLTLDERCTRVEDPAPGRGSVLACSYGGRGRLSVPASPGAGYRFRLWGKASSRSTHSLAVTEWYGKAPVRTFRFPAFSKEWNEYQVWLPSAPQARHLVMEFRTGPGIWFDDIVVERLELTREQELSLVKYQDNRSPLAPGSWLARRGRLLPIGDPRRIDSPNAENDLVRDAILAPESTRISYQLDISPGARLSLAYALARESAPGDGAHFRVLVGKAGEDLQRLFEDTVSIRPESDPWSWREKELPLDRFAGRNVRLTLETQALSGSRRSYALWGSPEIYLPREAGDRPNVILIAVDTLRADRLSCYGNRPGVSPQIDSLAADGIRFDSAIAASNWTQPSFISLFTNRSPLDLRDDLLSRAEPTLAEHFQAAGWSTAAIVYKPALYKGGFERGFDTFLNAPRSDIRAEENLAKALDWLKTHRDRKFFLFLHFNDPHQPFCQPESRVSKSSLARLRRFDLRLPFFVSSKTVRRKDPENPLSEWEDGTCEACFADGRIQPELKALVRDLYDETVRYLDAEIGVFLSALKRMGLYDDAVIAFMSDHGETLWTRGEQFGHGGTNLHDELIRVPLILKPPASRAFKTGRTITRQVHLDDLRPTLAELARLDDPAARTGARSLVPALASGEDAGAGPPAYSANYGYRVLSMRYQNRKYIRDYSGTARDRHFREELYDLVSDPGEIENVAQKSPRILAKDRLAMDEFLLENGVGRVVLVKTDGASDAYRITLEWDRAARPLDFGFPLLNAVPASGGQIWEGVTRAHPVALLVPFEVSEEAGLRIAVHPISGSSPAHRERIDPGGMTAYPAGRLEEILAEPGVDAFVFDGRRKRYTSTSAAAVVDDEQLRIMKALGYVD